MELSAEDKLAIMDTLSRYNQAIDNHLPDGAQVWADCFTDEGTFRAVTRSGGRARDRMPEGMYQAAKPGGSEQTDPGALIALEGREQLLAFATAAHAAQGGRAQPGYHWVSNVLIEGERDQATMTCYLRVMAGKTADLNEIATSTGYYRDRLRKVNGRWKFESRFVTFDD
jgi:hypothetical protein